MLLGLVESECKMISEPVELVCSMNGKVGAICENGTDNIAHEELNGTHRNMEVATVCSYSDENGRGGNLSVVSIEGSSQVELARFN